MPRYSEREAREAVAASTSYSEAIRRLGLRPAGGNHALFRRYVDEIWKIPTDHFDAGGARRAALGRSQRLIPLEEILVEGSGYCRTKLKRRLYEAGLKQRVCELCGQGEIWSGRRMSLILDHINGVANDNRLENLRIVCPNCNATLPTHCGRANRRPPIIRGCEHCGATFTARYPQQRFCSSDCGVRWKRIDYTGRAHPETRKVERPPEDRLLADIAELGYSGTGRKYGVSDNAIRKWVVWYERQRQREERLRADEAA